MNEKKRVNPQMLYPMITIESIDPSILNKVVEDIKQGESLPLIEVINFKNYYLIYKGAYEVLAANIMNKLEIDVVVVDWHMQNNWLSEENIEKQLSVVGMNALYDFEAIGGFKYLEYPSFYRGGK